MNSEFDEEQWVINLREALDEHLELETEIPVHIFTVPPTLMAIDPFSFIPQQVSIGPYHFSRPELNDMELHKLAAAKRNQREIQNFKIKNLVEHLIELEPCIRASYHKVLNLNSETLAWMMAIDASFLFEFLQVCEVSQGNKKDDISSKRLSHLVNLAQNITNSMILRDIIKLENQIPLFLLRKLLEMQFSSLEEADETLLLMLTGFCRELTPFKMVEKNLTKNQLKNCSHLLEVLYLFVVPKVEGISEINEFEEKVFHMEEEEEEEEECENAGGFFNDKNFINRVWEKRPTSFIKKIKFPTALNMGFLSKIPIFKILPKILNSLNNVKECNDQEAAEPLSNGTIPRPPLLEEIEIPSVTALAKSGVHFRPTDKGIESISFDVKNTTLYLPVISLDANSPVVLRNLVAYEACNASGPLVLTRYTELLNGIIDTKKDAKILREKGIIINRLKSDEEVTNLCNGMCKSLRLTKVPCIDKVVEGVNKYYNGTWKVVLGRYMKTYVFQSWRILTLLAAVVMLMLMGLQAFCQVYSCYRFTNIKDSD